MATLLAPYNTAMQLGAGFNSYTQQLCINNAVIRDKSIQDMIEPEKPRLPMAQEVTYKTSVIDKVTDVTNAMNINAAFSIKYDTFDAKGKGDFINTSKVKESDVSFMISVKVVNQVIYDHSLTKFDPIPDVKPANFAEVYGDSYISGFQEGGEFTAVISIKAKDRKKAAKIKADAAINFTKENFALDVNGDFSKIDTDFLQENETTVSVTWTGGGQDIKKPEDDWTLETMRTAALKFPDLVAKTPMRTHAILTKYTALRSFHAALAKMTNGSHDPHAVIPNFEKAGIYTAVLQEAYLDFKTILKNLQVLAFSVSSGAEKLIESPASRHKSDNGVETPGESDDDEVAPVLAGEGREGTSFGTKPYPPTIAGLERARNDARFMLNRIVAEVDTVTRKPELAVNEARPLPYLSPFIFKELLPEGRPVKEKSVESGQPNGLVQDGSQAQQDAGVDDNMVTGISGSRKYF
ncbi:hypothetical protein QBC40DRAFT_205879 [Triangularia verruculosa]|uniref:Uncharacterized protein n=1 Tax=Triangularia verruculosa TaxID=2587418 RepID=A0AAN6XEI8_9PEZI|nr:hypothetical protein QBC40DRAFT_205879 [Triangularia verruculosa]